jgi:hypothetical protein
MRSSEIAIKELGWYLLDHLFRQSNAGKNEFSRESLPNEMATLYLRYRGEDPRQLSETMDPVIHYLILRKVIEQNGDKLKMTGRLRRFQCAKCFYINYLNDVESRLCIKCKHDELHDFPRSKA